MKKSNKRDACSRIYVAIMEDIPSVSESYINSLADFIDSSKVRYSCFQDPRELIKELEEGVNFDVVILDLRLPYMNGIEVLRRVKELNSQLSVIIISAYTTIQDVRAELDEFIASDSPYANVSMIDKPVTDFKILAEHIMSAYKMRSVTP